MFVLVAAGGCWGQGCVSHHNFSAAQKLAVFGLAYGFWDLGSQLRVTGPTGNLQLAVFVCTKQHSKIK